MECSWDAALFQRGDEIPPELLEIIRNGSNEQYLESITKAALDPRYTYILFAHCENIFAHVCARLRHYGTLPSAVATLGRIIPFAPYLSTYAQRLVAAERYHFTSTNDDEDTLYLLGLFRLASSDWTTFKEYIDPSQISELLRHTSRPIVYLTIRLLQLYLQGSDHWFESMIKQYLGQDSPETGIDGGWDDVVIDYRFLTLWEHERHERVLKLKANAASDAQSNGEQGSRIVPQECFDRSITIIGGTCLPKSATADRSRPAMSEYVVETATVQGNLTAIAKALKSSKPVLLSGLAGAGKTMLARHAANKLGKLDKMVTLHLNEQSDAKLLIGIYTTGDAPGSFVWKPGVLTTAVQEGRWVLIEDLDRAPNEVIGTLLPLIEKGELLIPSRKQTVHAAPGFRIIATVRSTINHRGEESTRLAHMLGARLWQNVKIAMPSTAEQRDIANTLFSSLDSLLPQLIAVYGHLQTIHQRPTSGTRGKVAALRPISPRDLFKWCGRVVNLLKGKASFTSNDLDDIFLEAIDCFLGALPPGAVRNELAAVVAEELHIDPRRRDYLLTERDVSYAAEKLQITAGRYSLARAPQARRTGRSDGTFSTNPHTSRMLERVAAAVVNREPLLLVGETGVGKTTAVQHLAENLGKKLVPFNLSQQSEAGDLLGGFKPVNARSLIVPMKDEFDDLFNASFSMSKNQDFVELLGKQMARGNWKAVCKLWQRALKMVDQQRLASAAAKGETPSKKRKVEIKRAIDFERWETFRTRVSDMEKRLAAGSEAFAFSFVEGSIIKAVRSGDWILLDEINLASVDTLESIADLLDPSAPSILLTEAGNVERIDAHTEFRVFAAMNPATDVGKKDLPTGIRSRFTELYVESPDKDIRSLQSIVRSYLRHEAATDQAIPLDVSTLYQKVIALSEQNKLVDGAGQKPHFSLRTLTRTLSYAKYIAPLCNLRRALFEGFQMSFLTFLDGESARLVQPPLEQHLFGKRTNVRAELQKALRKPTDGHEYVQGWPGSKHWVRRGRRELEDQPHYILTPFIRSNIENLVRATSTRQFPVLIQGPTSSGKTSMIEYLAKRTGHNFVRINNHEHTDLQEYLGTYISGTDGKLQFQEGILVNALREGHWIVLDELNLAPTDVLEALNRLLDDNRELLIPETQEVIRPHEDFMLFATQNPAGLYGGRKTLSRAFRNRFLELHFDDIPIDELQEILHRRTQLPESRCKRIVAVYRELSVLRQESRLFEQKSFATLRDLFRWALRPNDTVEQLAANGFMLLAERVRKPEERQVLKETIEKAMSANGPRVSIDEHSIYAKESSEVRQHQQDACSQDVVWTKAMRRLYVLVSRAIANNEPVLLVGETGCGKTTVCQMLADAFSKDLHTVNAHQNTETGDLIGSQRPIRNRAVIEAGLRSQLLDSSLLHGTQNGSDQTTDALLAMYDNAITRLGKDEHGTYQHTREHQDIRTSRIRLKALFEWADGSLVQAMRSGTFFLLDEISLADDSVLERINSVLESQRTILLAEKGSLDSFVTAASGFQFFATMNPGGDYGKRELSPALRNRFTEIWVPSLNDAEDVTEIVTAKLAEHARPYGNAIVAFAQWFKRQYNTSASSSVSIRDVLAWVGSINAAAAQNVQAAVVHGAAMVYIDTLGANPAGLMTMTKYSLDQERQTCLAELGRLLRTDAAAIHSAHVDVRNAGDQFKAGDFAVQKRESRSEEDLGFSFDPPTTKVNTMRVVRALQLTKPVMLEGNPGVGKTALVTAVAEAVGVPLTRINLSEQTDLIDLFGSDVPVEGAETGSFTWRDAPFLRAMKNGEWVLLDEMNLASQSVLEGLNACLDHRGEVFVPELGQSFTRHPDFRLFAAQNPHHQGGGRKGLPASFVNRFTVVYADAFKSNDLMLICRRRFPTLDEQLIARAVDFVEQLEHEVNNRKRIGANGGPWEFNLRDVSRWLALASSDQGLLKSGTPRDFVDLLFSRRFRSTTDRAVVFEIFDRVFDSVKARNDLFSSVSTEVMQLGLGLLPRATDAALPSSEPAMVEKQARHSRVLESLMLCIQQRWPVILTGRSGVGKTNLIERLASATGAPLVTIAMNAETDAMDMVGGYEQSDPHRETFRAVLDLQKHLLSQTRQAFAGGGTEMPSVVLNVLRSCESAASAEQLDVRPLMKALKASAPPELQTLANRLQTTSTTIDKARFEWIDGLLVDALQEGKWLVLDNANLCSSSVLDRLNSLLEPNGSLIMNEHSTSDGAARVISPHPNFRIFLTLDPRYGELSRAMRNRAVELYLARDDGDVDHPGLDPLFTESAVARLKTFMAVTRSSDGTFAADLVDMVQDHMSASDQHLLPRFKRQLGTGLYNSSQVLATMSPELQTDLVQPAEGFHQALISQLQGPADFASVQTVHPLNNQPLVCTSPRTLSQASSLAVSFDLRVRIASMQDFLRELQSNTALMKQLRRMEQSWVLQARSNRTQNESLVVSILSKIIASFADLVRSPQTIPADVLQSVKLLLGRLCSIWILIYHTVTKGHFDQATLSTYSAIASKFLRSQPLHESEVPRILSQLGDAFDVLSNISQDTKGLACTTLWYALRPWTPATLDQLKELLDFETLVDRFDALCRTSKTSLDDATELRVQLAQALRLARHGGRDLAELTEKLQVLTIGASEADEADPLRSAHFLPVFERLCKRFASVTDDALAMEQSDLTRLEIFAQLPTTQSRLAATRKRGFLLPSHVSKPVTGARNVGQSEQSLNRRVAVADQVSLAELDAFTAEVGVLGKQISSQAHVLDSSELDALDRCLLGLLSELMTGLDGSDNEELRALAGAASQDKTFKLSSARRTTKRSHWLENALARVHQYARDAHSDSKFGAAANAWTSLALVGLHLYISGHAFDPALEPLVKLQVYRHQREDLSRKCKALRTLRSALTGESHSLRARLIEADIAALGPEPEAAVVCRPQASELSRLQSEFDALSRTLEPYQQHLRNQRSLPLLDETAQANIERTKSRLKNQYRAYDDLTGPVVLFIDCLQIGNDIAFQAQASAESRHTIEKVVPFVDASLNYWLRDGNFLEIAASASSVQDNIRWLSALALRCRIRRIEHCSQALRTRTAEAFQRFYAAWRVELSEDQRKSAAKSSLYKFKGSEDDQTEPSQEELEELFPSGSGEGSDSDKASAQALQDQASTIAGLHALIYGLSGVSEGAATELLRQWLSTSSSDPFSERNRHVLPATIFNLGELRGSLSAKDHAGQQYNMYTDSNLPEMRRLHGLLQEIKQRFKTLQRAWPDHATPGDALLLCSHILATSHLAPLPHFFPLLERLHGTITEWQKIASREYSAAEVLDELTNVIISWRQLELSAWAGVLDREWTQCETAASSWWFVAYESIIAAAPADEVSGTELTNQVKELLRTLSGFMSVSGLGEYSARLKLLRGFEAELASVRNSGRHALDALHAGLQNFISYYSYFELPVSEALAKGRMSLEKEAKNIIQVASWKDRNIAVLRQSAQSSHRKVLKLVKKYRSLLAQPVTAIVQAGIAAKTFGNVSHSTLLPGPVEIDSNAESVGDLVGLEAWNQRAERFRNAARTADLVRSKSHSMAENFDGNEQLQRFDAQLETDIASLQKATPSLMTEENKTLVNHLKTRKRRLFADVLKEVRSMGFQASIDMQTLSKQVSSEQVLARLPALIHDLSGCQLGVNAFELYRLVDIMATVRNSGRSYSDDLTPAEVSRSTSLLENMLQQSIAQYCDLNAHASACSTLQAISRQFVNMANCQRPMTSRNPQSSAFQESLASLLLVLPVCIQTLTFQMNMAVADYSVLIQALTSFESRAQQMRAQHLPNLPADVISNDHQEFQEGVKALCRGIHDAVEVAVQQHPEVKPVTAQLLRWVGSDEVWMQETPMNGTAQAAMHTWIPRLLDTVDSMLVAIQDAEKLKVSATSDGSWLVTECKLLSRTLDSLRVPAVTAGLQELLSQLRYLESADDVTLEQVVMICRSVSPIVISYAQAAVDTLTLQSSLHAQTSRTAYKLATTLITLCQKGFCTPSDKSDDQDRSEGNVESGTGLGDGEGAEDISKDIAPDEDLSELAQDTMQKQEGDEIEDQKDAVDMADEDMKGEMGDTGEPEDGDGDASGDDADENGEVDEEFGEVDDNGPSAVDEKMWDSGKDETQREKQTDEAKGQNSTDAAAARKEGSQEHDGEEQDGQEADAEGGTEEMEEVQKDIGEQVDPHTQDEENLELPEGMTLDNKKGEDSDMSDMESIPDENDGDAGIEQDAEIDEEHEDAGKAENEDEREHSEDEKNAMNAGDDAVDEDAASDVLMKEDEQTPSADPQSNAIVPPEAGSGPNQAESTEQDSGQGKSSGGPESKGQNDQEDTKEAKSEGAQNNAEASSGGDQDTQEKRLPFKQIGDALHEWYNQNADIEKAQEPSQAQNSNEAAEQPATTQFQHLPSEDAQADTQALGTASAEESMALDKDQALPVNEEKEPEELPFEEHAEESEEDSRTEGKAADAMQVEPSDKLRQETHSNAFVGEPQDGDLEMADDLEISEKDAVDDMDQQLLETHISHEDAADETSIDEARQLWASHEDSTRNLALVLTEHLRLILQPTQATKMRGDFRTGKRLNIKRIIPYIASSYKRDKIWMRRSVPSKRAYQVMLAIDDSKSMMESESRHLAFETLAMVTKSLSMLEVGELSVVGFGEEVKVAHEFGTPFSSDAGAEIFKKLTFMQSKTNVRKLLAESIELFRAARLKASGSASDLWQLQLIVSDGICEDHPSIRQLVRQAHEERIMIVFIVVDAAAQKKAEESGTKQSILDLQTAEFAKDAGGEMQLKMVKYLDTFPFRYYLIVRDVQELPGVLAGALRQWFAEVVETSG